MATVKGQFTTFLGLKTFKEKGINDFEIVYKNSWQTVINSVVKGEVDIGFVHAGFYDNLSFSSKVDVEEFYRSNFQRFSHLFMIDPNEKELRSKILDVLLNLDEKGKELAQKLHAHEFYEVSSLDELKKVVENANL
nr:PhnD/SsuA/transferrin family substrate-binding protein [Hydrogenothermus marinus]